MPIDDIAASFAMMLLPDYACSAAAFAAMISPCYCHFRRR